MLKQHNQRGLLITNMIKIQISQLQCTNNLKLISKHQSNFTKFIQVFRKINFNLRENNMIIRKSRRKIN